MLSGVGKNDSRYWRSKIFRRTDPRGIEAAHYTALAKHKAQWPAQNPIVSVGEWLSATQRLFTRRPATFGDYARSLRLIVSEILAVSKGHTRFGRSGANDYRHTIEGAPLAILSAEAVREWQIHRFGCWRAPIGNPSGIGKVIIVN